MTKKIKIYVRTDLRTSSKKKVPNGKMASQCAHALMGGFLSLFESKEQTLELGKGNEDFLESLLSGKIEYEFVNVKSEEDILKIKQENYENAIVITDQGRTSFKEPTITTMALLPKGLNHFHFVDCGAEYAETYRSKQVIVLNKEAIKDKWEMFEVVSKVSLMFLEDLIKSSESGMTISLENEGLKNWIKGAFAKITIKPKNIDFSESLEKLEEAKSNNVYTASYEKEGVIKCIAFGADKVDIIDQYTKEGYTLA